LNIYSQVGLVTLVGLVSKNGILIVEFANGLQRQGNTKREAVAPAALTRLRPILMTTGATIAGHFPLVLVTGAGAQAATPSVWCWWAAWPSAPCSPCLSFRPFICWWPATTPGMQRRHSAHGQPPP
jgi:hypothetical protein